MKPAIAYLRVSTQGQVLDGVSLEAQETKIKAWATANDYKILAFYTDEGLSGGRADNRPALQKAPKEAKNGTALVVYSLSRLARSTRDAIAISDVLEKVGADLVSLTEKLDTTSASGKMIFRLMAVLAEFERDLISERTKMAMGHMRSKGQRVGHEPYGWTIAKDGKTLLAKRMEQMGIRAMGRLRSKGLSYAKVAERIKTAGFKTKAGGRCWYPKVVRGILQANPQVTIDGRA